MIEMSHCQFFLREKRIFNVYQDVKIFHVDSSLMWMLQYYNIVHIGDSLSC